MPAFSQPTFSIFQRIKHHDWWLILVFVASALCFGWVATIPMSTLLLWRAAEILVEQHMQHHVHLN